MKINREPLQDQPISEFPARLKTRRPNRSPFIKKKTQPIMNVKNRQTIVT